MALQMLPENIQNGEKQSLHTKAMKILQSKLDFHSPDLLSEVFKIFMTKQDLPAKDLAV
jgi:hypothetical protein